MQTEVASDLEFEIARKIAKRAMIAGWTNALHWGSRQEKMTVNQLRNLLDRVSQRNDQLDPTARIAELQDWDKEKRQRSRRASSKRG